MLKPDVVKIGYEITEDHTGDPCINFRVLLTDEAARYVEGDDNSPLFLNARRAEDVLREKTHADDCDCGLFSYFNFRSVSEQEELGEASWG